MRKVSRRYLSLTSKGISNPFGGFYVCEGDSTTEEGVKRKFSAIPSADVKGYSPLMGEDDNATVSTLNRHRQKKSTCS